MARVVDAISTLDVEVEAPEAEGPSSVALDDVKFRRRRRRRKAVLWISVGWVVLVVGCSLFSDLLPIRDANQFTDLGPRVGIDWRFPEPLGTDLLGRSMASRLIVGARQSLLIAAMAVGLSFVAGSAIGLISGYVRGYPDELIGIGLDSLLAFPPLILLLTVGAVGGRTVEAIVVALALLGTPGTARQVRARTLALADREFVLAARAMGAGRFRIMVREIFPNAVLPLIPLGFLGMAAFMVAEGSLAFLGLGVFGKPSWGNSIEEARHSLQSTPHLFLEPAVALVVTVLALRLIGERLRARFDFGESKLS